MHDSLGQVSLVIDPPVRDLGDGFRVRRALPNPQRRMVGPFVFLDQMGPHAFAPGTGLDVRPHPHIGLATLTYLFEGEILHRDSLGTHLPIRPGEVNWMTAGRGIVHSERTAPEQRPAGSRLFGLQCWVGLPRHEEDAAPSFTHLAADALPKIAHDGVRMTVVAGSWCGERSPVPVLSPLFFVDAQLDAGACLQVPADYAEQAIQVVAGEIEVDGVRHGPGRLLVLQAGAVVPVRAPQAARVVLLGGEPLDGPRAISWNFVASSAERLERAARDWREGRFPPVPGETEFIAQPEAAGKPVFYP